MNRCRPTPSIVKNALFNILGDIEGLTFIDLFAGTGQIGLEAERRGAKVIFVERDHRRAMGIRKKTKGKVIRGDALKVLKKLKGDIIFADPPYGYTKYESLIEIALGSLTEGGVFILEHSKKKSFGADRERIYGDTVLSFWWKG